MDSWTCLLVEKGPGMLDDAVRTALKVAACDLHLKRWDTMHIMSDVCEGIIATSWSTHTVGARAGVLFRAEVDAEAGLYRVNFLLNIKDLERGAELLKAREDEEEEYWVQNPVRIPVAELYMFEDLRRRHSSKMQ